MLSSVGLSLLPTYFSYSLVLGKDTLSATGILLIFNCFLVGRFSKISDFLIFGIGVGTVFLTRAYLIVPGFVAIFAYILLVNIRNEDFQASRRATLVVAVTSCLFFIWGPTALLAAKGYFYQSINCSAYAHLLSRNTGGDFIRPLEIISPTDASDNVAERPKNFSQRIISLRDGFNSVVGDSSFNRDFRFTSDLDVLSGVPKAIITTLMYPFYPEPIGAARTVGRGVYIVYVETVVFLFCLLTVSLSIVRNRRLFYYLIPTLVFSGIVISSLGLVVNNGGALVRLRLAPLIPISAFALPFALNLLFVIMRRVRLARSISAGP